MLGKQLQTAAAGSAGGEKVYVDDVFSTFLYTGTSAARSINNGIDLAGEGGLVWIKNRGSSGADNHVLHDTERGASDGFLESNSNSAKNTGNTTNGLTSFNSNGFSLGSDNYWNVNRTGIDIVSWTFRKAPGFFDVVTYTGTGSAQSVSHSLGSTPGCVMIKKTSSSQNWLVYHRSLSSGLGSNGSTTSVLHLNTTGSVGNQGAQGPTATASALNLSTNWENDNGATYVAYLFAHDDQSFGTAGNEAIIKCGSYTGNGTTSNEINVGFEPQWLLVKPNISGKDWDLVDIMRGMSGNQNKRLYANLSNAEANSGAGYEPKPNGFNLTTSGPDYNQNGSTYIYIAIRRPHKPPESGTEVFAIDTVDATAPNFDSGFVVDAALRKPVANSYNPQLASRLTGGKYLRTSTNDSELDFGFLWDFNNGFDEVANSASTNIHAWMFKRAPGFMDVVCYTGNGANRSLNHNLGVAPELILLKNRTDAHDWFVYAEGVGNDKQLSLNTNGAAQASSRWQSTTPTSTQFYINSNSQSNGSGSRFIAYLFASLSGISKVGTYTGANSAVNVDCGFTNGARFVLIKRIGTAGHWYLWDSTRGIASGNDPYIILSDSSPTTTTQDHIDPLSSGFKVNYTNFSAINGSGHEYLFLAIA